MDNLRLSDYLVAGRYFLYLSACLLVTSEWQTTAANAADRPQLTQHAGSPPTATAAMQKVQRLLKLLSDRYPEQYGSVDPGRLDGILGEETKVAIRNFREIAGLSNDPRPDSELTTAILSELAHVTSVDQASPPAASEPTPAVAATPPANTLPAQPAAAAQVQETVTRNADKAAQPSVSGILYFVQVASLRSIESAEKEWKRIKSENRAALEGEQIFLERVEIRDRGVFHRILVGPMPSRDDANTLCGYLKQNDQTCVVTQRRSAEINKVDFRKLSSSAAGANTPRLPWEKPEAATGGDAAPAPAPAETTEPAPATQLDRAMAPAATPMPVEPADKAPAEQPTPPAPATDAPKTPTTDTAGTKESPIPTPPVAMAPVESAAPVSPPATPPAAPAPVRTAELPTPATPSVPAAPHPGATAPQTNIDAHAMNSAGTEKKAESQAPAPTPVAPPAAKGDEKSPATEIRISVESLQGAAAAVVVLAFLLAGGFLFYRTYRVYRHRRRKRRAMVAMPVDIPAGIPDASPLSAMEAERHGELESLSQLEEAFDSVRLQESRRLRDEFLRDVLDDDPDDPSEIKKQDSAIRVNSNLKTLLASDPDQYKAIFLNLIFLSKVGAALNRRDIALEELNGKFGRELMLLQSYFKIHILELDDRHRIRQELPGLFYCLQLSQLHQRQGKRHFSAA